jgi:hypothetical protein
VLALGDVTPQGVENRMSSGTIARVISDNNLAVVDLDSPVAIVR